MIKNRDSQNIEIKDFENFNKELKKEFEDKLNDECTTSNLRQKIISKLQNQIEDNNNFKERYRQNQENIKNIKSGSLIENAPDLLSFNESYKRTKSVLNEKELLQNKFESDSTSTITQNENVKSDSVLFFITVEEYRELLMNVQSICNRMDISDEFLKTNYKNIEQPTESDLEIYVFYQRIQFILNTISLTYTDNEIYEKYPESFITLHRLKSQFNKLSEGLLTKINQSNSSDIIIVINDKVKHAIKTYSDYQAKEYIINFLEKLIKDKKIIVYELIESFKNFEPNTISIKKSENQTYEKYDKISFFWNAQLDYQRNVEDNIYHSFIKNIEFMKGLRKRLSSNKICKSMFSSRGSNENDVDITSLCDKFSKNENNITSDEMFNIVSDLEKISKVDLIKYIIKIKINTEKLEEQITNYKSKLSKAIETVEKLEV